MLELKLNHVSKRGPRRLRLPSPPMRHSYNCRSTREVILYGKLGRCLTTTKQNKVCTRFIICRMYCVFAMDDVLASVTRNNAFLLWTIHSRQKHVILHVCYGRYIRISNCVTDANVSSIANMQYFYKSCTWYPKMMSWYRPLIPLLWHLFMGDHVTRTSDYL